jgi:hypothetical protein
MALGNDSDLLWARKLRKQEDLVASREMLDRDSVGQNTTLRAYLLQTLGAALDAETRELLTTYLTKDPAAPVRSMAAQALGRIGSSWAVPQLIDALTDQEKTVREAAALSLGTIGDPVAVHALCDVLSADESAMTRSGAAVALGRIGDPAATRTLMMALNDEHLIVRRDAVRSLARLGGGEEVRQAVREMARSVRNTLIWPSVRNAMKQLS